MHIAEADIVQERIGGQHPLRGKKEEGGVDEADDDGDLKEIEKDLGLHAGAPMRLRKEEHHQDGSAVEGIEQVLGRVRQDGLVEQGVVGLNDCGNEQDHENDGEQKPEQGDRALGAAESNPGTSDGEKIVQDDNGLGEAATRQAGSEHEEAERLGGEKEDEEKPYEPRLAQVRELAQAGAMTRVEMDCGIH